MKRVLIAFAFVLGVDHAHAQESRPRLELPQQSLTDGDKVKLGPMSIPSSRAERDTRPFMIGGGIVVLAAVMWWNRKQRERFDRSDARETPSRPTTESREDTDDLQAAARGDREEK
jgi:hypothetical protein